VLAMFAEERPHLRALPLERLRFFRQVARTVDDAGCVQADGSYYGAGAAPPYSQVTVRIYEHLGFPRLCGDQHRPRKLTSRFDLE